MSEAYIIDTSVILYKVLHAIQSSFDETELDPHSQSFKKAIYYAKLSMEWTNRLGFLPDCDKKKSVVWVADGKPYWRVDRNPDYKGNRKVKPQMFSYLQRLAKNYLPMTITGYEADDLAALAYKVWLKMDDVEELNLCTVDTDWMGLAQDEPYKVCNWIDVGGFEPRVRNREETWYWIKSKFKQCPKFNLTPLDKFSADEIWDFKAQAGDRSDNMEPGSPLDMISLLEPPEQHKLWLNRSNRVSMKQRLSNTKSDHKGIERLEHEISKLGMEPPIKVIPEGSKIKDKYVMPEEPIES